MKFKYKSLVLLFIATLLSGCLNNIDFDQVNLDIEPVINVPLVSFELDQLDFFDVDNSIEIETVTDISDLEIFESSTFQNDLLRFDAIFQMSKDFERIFTVNIDFLDVNDNITFSTATMVLLNTRTRLDARVNINVSEFPLILNTSKVRIRIRLIPGVSTIIDPDVARKFEFKSVGVFYLRL